MPLDIKMGKLRDAVSCYFGWCVMAGHDICLSGVF